MYLGNYTFYLREFQLLENPDDLFFSFVYDRLTHKFGISVSFVVNT